MTRIALMGAAMAISAYHSVDQHHLEHCLVQSDAPRMPTPGKRRKAAKRKAKSK
jgi:hypothetical protein